MKKTYTISLGGRIFHLEEDAGDQLQSYIDTLEKYYSQEEGGSEIMNDIECRIAELFLEYMQEPGKEVITLEDIRRITEIMGSPDDIIDDDYNPIPRKKSPRILYRDTDHSMLGGVAAGIGAYLNIPLIWIRFIFLLLAFFYGVAILIYIILWIIIPPALTSKQKLEMKGEKINISNIERNIKDGINNFNNNGKIQEGFQKTSHFLANLLTMTGQIFLKIGKVLLNICAFIILIGSVIVLALAVFSLISVSFTTGFLPLFALNLLMPGSLSWLFLVAIALAFIPPFLLLIWLTSKYLFQFKNKNYMTPITLAIIWIIGIIMLVSLSFFQAQNFSEEANDLTATTLKLSPAKPLVLIANPKYTCQLKEDNFGINYNQDQNTKQLISLPHIIIEKATENKPELIIIKKASGFSQDVAFRNTQNIDYHWELRQDTLFLDNYFALINSQDWKANKVDIRLRIPENYTLFLDSSIKNNLHHIGRQYSSNWDNYKGTNQFYMMTEEGLKPKN